MSMETVRLITELTRAARVPGAGSDPAYFARKAEAFDAIADDDPNMAAEARELAESARARARELRGGGS
jgi:hypothetical protein